MHRLACALLAVMFLTPLLAWSQGEKAPAAASATEEMLGLWDRMTKMVTDMAENFPEEKYDFKATPEVRSFREQLLHVAGANYFFMGMAGGMKSKASHVGRETKADVVAVVKESFADGRALIEQQGDAGLARAIKHPFEERNVTLRTIWSVAIGHSGEHFGQLVVYYRLSGLVPPTTAQQQSQ